MIKRFHQSLKFAQRARLAGSDWFSHLPLVMLGLWTALKDDSGFYPAEAVYGTHIFLLGEIIEHLEFPLEVFLQKVKQAVSGFSRPQSHHLTPPQPQPLPRAFLNAEFVFVCDDTTIPPLALLHRGPYKVLKHCEKFCILQVRNKSDSVSLDKSKPVFSSIPVTAALPLPQGHPCLVPASVMTPLVSVHMKKVRFLTPVPAPPES